MTGLASMTAFARRAVTIPQGALAWEIKSVNHKGLDLRLRLPPGFDAWEAACRDRVARGVARGAIQATLTLQRRTATPRVRIDGDLLRQLIDAASVALPAGSPIAPPTFDGLLAVRGVVDVVDGPDTEADRDAVADAALALLEEAMTEVQASRHREGTALGIVLTRHLEVIAVLTTAADDAPGRTPAAAMARLTKSIEALVGTAAPLDPARLHQEALLMASRDDVREEIDRLRIHGGAAMDLVRAGGPIGRRLDFLAQELAREANTLCAKSSDTELTAIGLDLRTRIEQFREQVQNLE